MRKILLFLFFMVIVVGCSYEQKPFSATYEGENENWKVRDIVNVTSRKTEHIVTLKPKEDIKDKEISVTIEWNGIGETKTIAKEIKEGVYKTPIETNSLQLHKKPLDKDIPVNIDILTHNGKQGTIKLKSIEEQKNSEEKNKKEDLDSEQIEKIKEIRNIVKENYLEEPEHDGPIDDSLDESETDVPLIELEEKEKRKLEEKWKEDNYYCYEEIYDFFDDVGWHIEQIYSLYGAHETMEMDFESRLSEERIEAFNFFEEVKNKETFKVMLGMYSWGHSLQPGFLWATSEKDKMTLELIIKRQYFTNSTFYPARFSFDFERDEKTGEWVLKDINDGELFSTYCELSH